MTFTKPGGEVFAGYDAGGAAREIVPAEAAVWASEVEDEFAALGDVDARIDTIEADLAAQVAVIEADIDARLSGVGIPSPYDPQATYITRRDAAGTTIRAISGLSAGVSAIALYRGCLWLKNPTVSGANVAVQAAIDNAAGPAYSVTIGANGLQAPAAWASNYIGIAIYFGHSDAQGSPDNSAITTSAIDAGNALMLASSVGAPYLADNAATGITNLAHAVGTGETPCASDYIATKAAIEAAGGTKFPILYVSAAVGGARIYDLLDDRSSSLNYWDRITRRLTEAVYYIRLAGKTPVVMPLVFGHFDADGSINVPYLRHTPAQVYLAYLRKLRRMFNASIRSAMGWSNGAPDLPVILWQTTEEPKGHWTGAGAGTPVFGEQTWGAPEAQWLAHVFDEGFICAGPDYWCPSHTDNQHRTSLGYYQIGHVLGRARGAAIVGRPFAPLAPVSISSVNSTTTDVIFDPPDGGSLVIDTTTVPDATNSMKGFRAWKKDSAGVITEVTISAVAIQGTNSVRLTHTAPALSDRLVIEYATYATDRTYSGNRGANGPRGNIRSNVARTTAQGTYYDWSMKYVLPVPQFHASVAVTRNVRDAISGYVPWVEDAR